MKISALILLPLIITGITGCAGIPEGIKPVSGFELEKYLGRWYEAARLDHSFERGLDNVTAEYSLRKDGRVKVLNRGFSASKDRWEQLKERPNLPESRIRDF